MTGILNFLQIFIYFLDIDDLVQLGKDELEKKRPRLDDSKKSPSASTLTRIQAPIIPATLVEDDSHFLLSRSLEVKDEHPEVKVEIKQESNGHTHLKEEGTIEDEMFDGNSDLSDRPKIIKITDLHVAA